MCSCTLPNPRFVITDPVPGATSTYPLRTTHFAGELSCDCHCARSLPSNSTIASDGGGTGGRSGPGSTTGGRGRSIEWTGQVWADMDVLSETPMRKNAECGVRSTECKGERRAASELS